MFCFQPTKEAWPTFRRRVIAAWNNYVETTRVTAADVFKHFKSSATRRTAVFPTPEKRELVRQTMGLSRTTFNDAFDMLRRSDGAAYSLGPPLRRAIPTFPITAGCTIDLGPASLVLMDEGCTAQLEDFDEADAEEIRKHPVYQAVITIARSMKVQNVYGGKPKTRQPAY